MTPRITPPAHFDDHQVEQLDKTYPKPGGEYLNLWKTLAHRPELLRRVNALGGYYPRHSVVGVRERELAILRTAARRGAAYVEAQHRAIAADAGVPAAEIAAAADPALEHAWAPADAALLAFVDEFVAHDTVGDATWSALHAHLGDDGVLELLVMIGFYGLIGAMLSAVRVEIDAPAA
ncbi:carboxymuconolactone decarboxylase family protein [Baekduia soli]|uniref:carboxymuconolactone decarboxylase family protein n=1 Tax=Baekduia soli TaxID=496014 RepID=UPI00165236EE|nr:carboxymuconolactone decarboxylase family protein [Baekduia soli]